LRSIRHAATKNAPRLLEETSKVSYFKPELRSQTYIKSKPKLRKLYIKWLLIIVCLIVNYFNAKILYRDLFRIDIGRRVIS
jgi:hypothetical protein